MTKGNDTAKTIASECIAVRVRMLNRVVSSIFDDALRPAEMTTGQCNILTALGARGPLQPSDLGRILHIEKSTLSRNIAIMEDRGWIRMGPGDDERSKIIEATKKGTELLELVYPAWKKAQERAKKVFGSSSLHELTKMVDAFRKREESAA